MDGSSSFWSVLSDTRRGASSTERRLDAVPQKAVKNGDGKKRFDVAEINAISIPAYALMLVAMLVFAYLHSVTGWHTTWVLVQEVSEGMSACFCASADGETDLIQMTLLIGLVILVVSWISSREIPGREANNSRVFEDMAPSICDQNGGVLPPVLFLCGWPHSHREQSPLHSAGPGTDAFEIRLGCRNTSRPQKSEAS